MELDARYRAYGMELRPKEQKAKTPLIGYSSKGVLRGPRLV